MSRIVFYEDRNGVSTVEEYLSELDSQSTKDARIRREKIRAYVRVLRDRGLPLPETMCKHIVDKIFELRPADDRVFFAGVADDTFVLLHCFKKQSQRTPRREIKRAQIEYMDFVERWYENGKG